MIDLADPQKNSDLLENTLRRASTSNPFWICGPCVIESREILGRIADRLASLAVKNNVPVIFKASLDKANRTDARSYRGPSLEDGLNALLWVKQTFGLPVLTDVHETSQVNSIAEVADVLQIPAFLCRQTDLIHAACATGRTVNVKKGQFMAPSALPALVGKLEQFGAHRYWITERGTCFGYHHLIVDYAALPEMLTATQGRCILDITHSTQLMSADDNGRRSGGRRMAIPFLARAGAVNGFAGFFAETHPHPAQALSDSSTSIDLQEIPDLFHNVRVLAETAQSLVASKPELVDPLAPFSAPV